jgi:Arc/MetJ family transcription regulator
VAEAQKASGHSTKKRAVEEALRLLIRLRRQRGIEYRWRGNLAGGRKGRGTL